MSTIDVAPNPPDPNEDCNALRKVLADVTIDKKELMGIICHRNQQQRSAIRHIYIRKNEEDLVQRLRRKLHGHFETGVALWMCEPAERDAVIIKDALMGWIKDLAAVAEILYYQHASLEEIRQAYFTAYNRSLEGDIGLKTSGDEKKLLLALVREDRPDVWEPDMSLAAADSSGLLQAVWNRKAIDTAAIIQIVSTRSPLQMKATLEHYREVNKHSFGKVIKQETKSSFQMLLRVVFKCAKNPLNYFAKALYTSMKGLGTDDSTLIRIVVTRAEIDMKDIKAHFDKKFERSLQEMVISDTSGSYRTFLLLLIGAPVK